MEKENRKECEKMRYTPEKKPRRRIRPLPVIIVLIILILAIIAVYFINIFAKLNHRELNGEQLGITSSAAVIDDGDHESIINIALFGVDQREGETKFRSDAVMVLTVDKSRNKIKLSSLMRDSLVSIDGYGKNKLAHAYFYGGPQLAVKTLNENFGLDIKEYVTVNFQEMAQMIDAVGGVEIDISEEERIAANGSIKEQSIVAGLPEDYIQKSGLQTLNGTQAVAYARIRKVGNGDFERTDRQREVLQKIFNKAIKMNPVQYPELARKFLPLVETSLDWGEIMNLAGMATRNLTFEDVRFPLISDLIGNGSIWINNNTEQCVNLDVEATGEHMRQFIYDDVNPAKPVSNTSSALK